MFGFKRPLIPVEISAAAYDEIGMAMIEAGAVVQLVEGALDMRSIGLVRGAEPERETAPTHRPITTKPDGPSNRIIKAGKKNTAPGAI